MRRTVWKTKSSWPARNSGGYGGLVRGTLTPSGGASLPRGQVFTKAGQAHRPEITNSFVIPANPSIVDFIAAWLRLSADEAIAACDGAAFFAQVERLARSLLPDLEPRSDRVCQARVGTVTVDPTPDLDSCLAHRRVEVGADQLGRLLLDPGIRCPSWSSVISIVVAP
jgi:hypothetical protein